MTTAADRARLEREAQGFATPAAAMGDARVAASYRRTSVVLASAAAPGSPRGSAGPSEPGATGAAGSGPSATEVPWGSAASNATAADQPSGSPAPTRRSTPKTKGHLRQQAALHDNAG